MGSGWFILLCRYQLSHYSSARRVSPEEQLVEEVMCLGMARERFLASGAGVGFSFGRASAIS